VYTNDTKNGIEVTPTITVLSQAMTKVPTLLLRMLEDIILQQIADQAYNIKRTNQMIHWQHSILQHNWLHKIHCMKIKTDHVWEDSPNKKVKSEITEDDKLQTTQIDLQ